MPQSLAFLKGGLLGVAVTVVLVAGVLVAGVLVAGVLVAGVLVSFGTLGMGQVTSLVSSRQTLLSSGRGTIDERG